MDMNRNRNRSRYGYGYGYGYGYIIISSSDLTRLGCEYTKGSVSELSDLYSIRRDAVLCNLI